MRRINWLLVVGVLCQLVFMKYSYAQEYRLNLDKAKMEVTPKVGNPEGWIDEQDAIIGPPVGSPDKTWKVGGQHYKDFPVKVKLDLGKKVALSSLWFFDTNGSGEIEIAVEQGRKWKKIGTYQTKLYKKWVKVQIDAESQFLQITRKDSNSNISEIAVYAYTPGEWERKKAEIAKAEALERERQAALAKAMEEMKKRPLVDLGEPFGKVYLIEEIDCSSQKPAAQEPANVTKVETILGKKCRVIPKTEGQGAYFSYVVGKMKLLQPGSTYVLVVEYPEDKPRTVIVSNTGNETIRGFHTGGTVGDAFHPLYVNNRNESINTPLSGKYENWTLQFRLHDRFTEYNGLPRGGAPRPRIPEQGFYVTIAQFSKKDMPLSNGAAVSRIRLFAVTEPEKLVNKINYPPKHLPKRRLFWREEMADGVVGAGKKRPEETRGVVNFLDWYKYKASRMKFLGMNTFAKDLLEFGACQGWDSTPHGGNKWVYFNSDMKDWWKQIVTYMGEEGFDVFPYYEYSGSKGSKGLGFQRRCRPLTDRPGNYYTHIKWVERATVDITDPDAFTDFKKMLDLTVVNLQDKANFAGVWLRPRGQIPVSFADATLARYNAEHKNETPVTRPILIKETKLYNKYLNWWGMKRRDFLKAMREYLVEKGLKDPTMLITGEPGEPGVGFGSWDPYLVTDQVAKWSEIMKRAEHVGGDGNITKAISVDDVVSNDMYLKGLMSPGLDWGGHEVRHARPGDDPQHYQKEDGLMMSHCFNRLYTVSSPKTFDAYRTKSGLTMVRHFSLNENMMFAPGKKSTIGYFVADMEKAGPFCMQAEAVAMANGNPTNIGYLSGGNYGRGFPEYVRNFNAAFLALPALPSTVVKGASSDPEVVVRAIKTANDGTYLAVVNTGWTAKKTAIKLPVTGKVYDASTGKILSAGGSGIELEFYPCQLKSLLIK